MVIDLIGDKDKDLRSVGLEQVRSEVKGADATRLFAAQLAKLDPPAQIGLLSALADRGDAAARPAVLELLASSRDKDENVRAAALRALGKLGSAADVPLLTKSLAAASEPHRAAARRSLVQLRGETVSKSLSAEAGAAAPAVKAAFIEVLAARRANDELPTFLAATVDESAAVRGAAMAALGQLGRPEQLAALLPGVLKAEKGAERDAAERNVALVCARIEDEYQRGMAMIQSLETLRPADRDELLRSPGASAAGGRSATSPELPRARIRPDGNSGSARTRWWLIGLSATSAAKPGSALGKA